MAQSDQGFQSEGLRAALGAALAGQPAELERLLARLGAVVTPKPNLRLAAAFGAEVAQGSAAVLPLLRRLGAHDAAPDTDQAFFPIAAAFGWAARLRAGRDVAESWAALAELCADERSPVRVGTRQALLTLALQEGFGDLMVAQAVSWLEEQQADRERHFGPAAMVVEVLGERRVQAGLRDHPALLDYLSRILDQVEAAPRAAERSEARRRLLAALPVAVTVLVAGSHAEAGHAWFEAQSTRAVHPAVREVLSNALIRMRAPVAGQGQARVQELRRSLQDSAKPLRDPSRLRPGTGRGKASRRTR